MVYEEFMMSKNKQCAVCEGHYDPSMLVGIMDTFMCDVCIKNLDQIMIHGDEEEPGLGKDYKKGLPKTSTRQILNGIPVFTIVSPVHPKVELEPTTA